MVVVIMAKLLFGGADLIETLCGGAIGCLALEFVRRLSMGRLGSGDVLFSALIGLAFGFWVWDVCILIAAVMGTIWIGIRKISSPRRMNAWLIRIPFAPFMFVSAILVFVCRSMS
jgi:prepilin signal peptidase PulO-like enzyme (type II secretory pathway)